MNLFRNLLFWLVLVLVGALVAQMLVQDPGEVLVRFRGHDYQSTVVGAVLLLVLALAALWLAWTVLALPFRGWRGFRSRQMRARLTDGLGALHQGHWARAEKLLDQAAERDDAAAVARVAAAQAADARADAAAAARQIDTLAMRHPIAAALARADRAIATDPAAALSALDAPTAQPLPPRGLVLRAQALAKLGRAHEAYGMLGALRQQQAAPAAELDAWQARWAAASLTESVDANALADRWDALPKPLQADPIVVAAYAARASDMRWDDAAARNIEQALATRWDESLVDIYGRLPTTAAPDARREQLARWLQAHPESPATLLALARLQPWPTAEASLHRAVAQGGGARAWEALAEGYTASGDAECARLSYANALRATRGEPTLPLPNRDLRQQIQDAAAIEIRDEHGLPRLRE